MNQPVCQSCGMPMANQNLWGTKKDGTLNEEYCKYCYEDGAFKKEETMEEMIESCIPFMKKEGMEEDKAREILTQQLPNLKRWK